MKVKHLERLFGHRYSLTDLAFCSATLSVWCEVGFGWALLAFTLWIVVSLAGETWLERERRKILERARLLPRQ